jgi:tetratricopeptide (TPR) repeat protein
MKRRLVIAAVVVLALAGVARGDDTLAQARQLLDEGKTQQAIDLLAPVVQADPKDGGATLLLGEAYLAADKADLAEAMGRAYIGLSGKKPEGYLLATRALVKQDRLPDAYAVIRKGVKSVKRNPQILSELGYVHLAADSIDQAIISLSEAKDIDPKSAVAYRGLGEAYLKLNADGVAILQFEESLRADSTQTDLKYQLARLYYKERRFNDAATMYASIISLNPGEDAASRELGLMLHLARQYSSAANVLETYVQRHPDDVEAWTSYMEALQQSKQYEGAVAAAEHVLSQDPQSPQAHRAAAKSDYMLKFFDKSIYHYGELEKVDSLTAEDTRFFAKAYHDAGNDSSAVVYFRRSAAQDSTQMEIYAEMGAAYMKLKQFDLAAAAYEQKFMMDSTATSAYVNYALCKEVLGDWKAGREALVKALGQNPSYIPGYYHLGYCLSQMDSTQSARKAYETFVGMADSLQSRYGNDLFSAHRFIAVVYLQDKRYEQAERALQKALALRPNDAELHLWLAQTQHALNKRDEARSEYQKVLKLDPNNKDAKKGLDILELYE